jgi:NAD+--asparagine ADP-ribosyltransferase
MEKTRLRSFQTERKTQKRLARSLLIKWTDKGKAFEKVFFSTPKCANRFNEAKKLCSNTLEMKTRKDFQSWKQGCQIFLGATYQNGEKENKLPQNMQNVNKIYQMAVKYTKCP